MCESYELTSFQRIVHRRVVRTSPPGVWWDASKCRWRASITKRNRTRHLGRFGTEEAAALAYDNEAKRRWENPILNFLPDGSLNPHRHQKIDCTM
jgi:hypothetical protein